MKAKEKLYHFIEKIDGNIVKQALLVFALLIVCLSIFSAISYIGLTVSMYEYELNAYPEDEYKELNEIADNLVIEGVGINSDVLPRIDNYNKENDNIIITYSVTRKSDSFIFPSKVSMTLKLSSDFHIISKESICSSKEVYSKAIKNTMIAISLGIGIVPTLVLAILFVFFVGKIYKEYKKEYKLDASGVLKRIKPL